MITRRTIPNPWLQSGRTSEELAYDSPWLADYVPSEGCEGWRLVLDGVGCVLPEAWSTTRIPDGMSFSLSPKIEDFTFWFVVGLIVMTVASVGYSVYAARAAADQGDAESLNNSATYGWEGVKNTISADIPVPIVYGTHRVGGNIINSYVSSEQEKFFLNMQIALSEGPIQSIAGITADTTTPLRSDILLAYATESGGRVGQATEYDPNGWGNTDMVPDGSTYNWANQEFPPIDIGTANKATDFLMVDLRATYYNVLTSTGFISVTGYDEVPPENIGELRLRTRRSWTFTDLTDLGITDEFQTFLLPLADFTTSPAGGTLTHLTSIVWWNSWYGFAPNTEVFMANAKIRHINNITSITDEIKVNNANLGSLDFAQVEVRLGNEEQDVMRGFRDLHNVVAYGSDSELPFAAAQTFSTHGDDVEAIEITITAPQLYATTSKGFSAETIELTFNYRLDGVGAWSAPLYGAVSGESGSPVRKIFRIDGIAPGQYEIRILKTSRDSGPGDDETLSTQRWESNAYVASIDEIRYNTLTYPFTAMLGIKILATDQISGSLPEVTTLIEGLKVETFTGSGSTVEFSDNPMWCLWNLLVNARYGAGNQITASGLDSTLALEGAEYCDELVSVTGSTDERRFELDVVLDVQKPALDMIRDIAQTFRGLPFWSEGTIKPLIDKVETPTAQFGMGNIVRGTFQESFPSLKQAPNWVEIQYADRLNDYERNSVVVEGDLTGGIRKQVMNLAGITRASQAQRIGEYIIRSGQHNVRSIQFEAASDAVLCDAGDVINFAQDVPGWSVSGRATASTNSTISLDQAVTLGALASGEAYYVDVRLAADDSMEQKTIADGAGTYAAGTPINIVGTWATNPSAYDTYILGMTGPKPFRIVEIGRTVNDNVEITAVEYSASVYSDLGNSSPLEYSYLPDPRKPPQRVTDISMAMLPGADPAIQVMWAVDTWSSDYGLWDHAEIWVSEGAQQDATLRGTTGGRVWTIRPVTPGTTYTAWIISVSTTGLKSSVLSMAPSAALTARRPVPPRKVSRLEVDHQGNDTEFTTTDPFFTWDGSSALMMAEPVGREPLGVGGTRNTGGIRDGFQVDISVDDVVVRTEHVASSHYQYSFANNASDNGGTPEREFRVTVRERDIYGQLGPEEWIDVSNSVPGLPANGSLEFLKGGTDPRLRWDPVVERDIVGYLVYAVWNAGPISPAEFMYCGPNTEYSLSTTDTFVSPPPPPSALVIYNVAAYDAFTVLGDPTTGKVAGLNYSAINNQ